MTSRRIGGICAAVTLALIAACGTNDSSNALDGTPAPTGSGGAGGSMGSGADGGFNPGENGGAGAGYENCAEATAAPQNIGVSMFIAVDKSGSMDGDKWDSAKAAFTAFFQDSAADAMSVALRFWPEGACDDDDCNVAACATPQVPLGSLGDAAHEQALINLFNATEPDGGTPMSAALAGATTWAVDQQTGTEGAERFVVLLLTDGEPNGCEEDIDAIAAIAGAAYASDVLTFAVGLEGSNEQDMDAIATAGGTSQGFFIGAANAEAELLAALEAIQQTAVACTFAMPESNDPSAPVDPSKVNVTYTPAGTSDVVTILQVSDESACDPTDGGWYYDDPMSPSLITLCPASCDAVQEGDGAEVKIVLGCATEVQ
jgi:hypothetical protein